MGLKNKEKLIKVNRGKYEFRCDKEIYKGIKWLNDNGLYTYECCCGHKKDDLYVVFNPLLPYQINIIQFFAEGLGFEIKIEDYSDITQENMLGKIDIISIRINKENKIDLFYKFIEKLIKWRFR